MKKTFKIITIASFAIAVALIAFVLISVAVSASNDSNISTAIIGGADGPTAIFITSTLVLSHPICIVGWCFVAIALLSSVGWALSKDK